LFFDFNQRIGLSKNKASLPKQSARSFCKEWDEQIISWEKILNTASQDFQQGNTLKATVTITQIYIKVPFYFL
jgi:hypothetical protein